MTGNRSWTEGTQSDIPAEPRSDPQSMKNWRGPCRGGGIKERISVARARLPRACNCCAYFASSNQPAFPVLSHHSGTSPRRCTMLVTILLRYHCPATALVRELHSTASIVVSTPCPQLNPTKVPLSDKRNCAVQLNELGSRLPRLPKDSDPRNSSFRSASPTIGTVLVRTLLV